MVLKILSIQSLQKVIVTLRWAKKRKQNENIQETGNYALNQDLID